MMSKTAMSSVSSRLMPGLFVSTGLFLSFTQPIQEESRSGLSLAQLRQQAWTHRVFSGQDLGMRGTQLDFSIKANGDLGYGSQRALIQIAEIIKDDPQAARHAPDADQPLLFVDRKQSIHVKRSGKGDRRKAWRWEPYRVASGRKAIGLNWSGAVWTMHSLFDQTEQDALPKQAFTRKKDRRMMMADAKAFLLPDPVQQPITGMMVAQADTGSAPQTRDLIAKNLANGSTSLAYAPTSLQQLEEPFRAILTEQKTGQVFEDNPYLNPDKSKTTSIQETGDAKENVEERKGPLNLIAALPRTKPNLSRLAASSKLEQRQIAKPLDTSSVLAKAAKKQPKSSETRSVTAQKPRIKMASLAPATVKAEKPKKKSRWASWFNFGSSKKKKVKIPTKGEHAWVSNTLPKSSYSKQQKTCLANAIYFESRSEPVKGQIAVAQVVMNRVKNPTYPNSICGVVYQNKHKRNACQFSFACDGIRDRILSKKAWDLAWKLSGQVINEEVWLKNIGSSTHYHATYVNPKWARTMKRRGKIGLHIFYKTYGGGWS